MYNNFVLDSAILLHSMSFHRTSLNSCFKLMLSYIGSFKYREHLKIVVIKSV